jgi:hypothetical protein
MAKMLENNKYNLTYFAELSKLKRLLIEALKIRNIGEDVFKQKDVVFALLHFLFEFLEEVFTMLCSAVILKIRDLKIQWAFEKIIIPVHHACFL